MKVKMAGLFLGALVIGVILPIVLLTQNSPSTSKVSEPKANTPLSTRFSLAAAPSGTLRGAITSLSGDVLWESRTASEASSIGTTKTIQQGELLTTNADGRVTVLFPGSTTLDIQPETTLSFVQTLPENIVLELQSGTISLVHTSTRPLSIRSLRFILRTTLAEMTISVDQAEGTASIAIASGSAEIAFNDTDNISNVVQIHEGQTLTYDNSTRTTELDD